MRSRTSLRTLPRVWFITSTVRPVNGVEPKERFSVEATHIEIMGLDKLRKVGHAAAHWSDLQADIDDIAAEYRDDGWETLVLHPGDVSVLPPTEDAPGFSLVVPQSEVQVLTSWIQESDAAFASFKVFRSTNDDLVFLAVVMEDAATNRAVLFPLYYDPKTDEHLEREAVATGHLYTHVKDLAGDETVSFRQDDPSLFVQERPED